MEVHIKKPTVSLEQGNFSTGKPILLILNQPIPGTDLLNKLWHNSSFRICADGGANRLHDALSANLEKVRDDCLPSCIHGDLDSLRPDVRQFYQQKGVSITQDDDQYSTDFCKAMKMIDRSRLQSTNDDEKSDWNQINILGSIAGRVDQGIGLLHEMLREQVTRPQLDFILFSDRSISYILHRGLNRIELDVSAGIVTPNVGILPIYGPATISTQGLEWDVQGWRTEMGGNMSTSNHVVRNVVEVDTDAKILFTIERAETLPRWSV